MAGEEKIGTLEILKVSRHGSGHYLRIPSALIQAFGIRKGDLLRTEIKTLIREGEGRNSTLLKKGCVSEREGGERG